MRKRRGHTPRKPNSWQSSAQWSVIGREAITAYNKQRHLRPTCGAHARSRGRRCTQIAMANGKCYLHGGRSPKGDGRWHVRQWPNRDAPNAEQKLVRKLRDQERAERKRAARIASMTPEERKLHQRWHATHRPGSKAARAAARAHRKAAKDARETLSKPVERPANPEIDTLAKRKAQLEAQLRALNQMEFKGGVFE